MFDCIYSSYFRYASWALSCKRKIFNPLKNGCLGDTPKEFLPFLFLHPNRVERIFVCYVLSFFLDSREIDFSGLAGTRGSIGRSDKPGHQRAFPPRSRIGFPPLRPCDCTACLTPTMLHNPFALFFLSFFSFFCVL